MTYLRMCDMLIKDCYICGGRKMALIKCPECGKEISDKAIRCPSCGYPIEKVFDEKRAPLLTSFSMALLLLFGISMFFLKLGWGVNSVLLIVTLFLSILALKSDEKGALLASIPLLISGIVIMRLIVFVLLR